MKTISLSVRIFINISLLLLLTIGMGATTIWFAGRFNGMLQQISQESINLVQASREMATELANQKGYVTYYFLDGDDKWLKELSKHRQSFREWLGKTYAIKHNAEQARLRDRIAGHYNDYLLAKDRVIELYQSGAKHEGEVLHWQVREKYFQLSDLCREYMNLNELQIRRARETSQHHFRQITSVTITLLVCHFILSALLIFNLISHIIIPIQRLSRAAVPDGVCQENGDELNRLKEGVHELLDERDRTRSELAQSKEMLLHSEKMALVGRLAPVVAHSIRNPMTSINMRLFSLQRNLVMTENQKEDFEVVCDEMRRLDNIVQNFLEFSKPHKLKKQRISISRIITTTLELLSYRLDLHNITIRRKQETENLELDADPGLLKEVFVNLVVNACEAMEDGGEIIIVEKEAVAENIGQAIMIEVIDNGPGMSPEMQARAFKPFETTKPDGTGLGLFIVLKIIEEHGGTLTLSSREGQGTTFTITLPGYEKTTA
ncbi:MAG: ATP-binding protein [Thermodesulfobacteriota bacterium]